jgi:bifunctional non-homologous end joining protein LigD
MNKHDGYLLQIHAREGRVQFYTMNGADWSKRYPLVLNEAARIKGTAILGAEVVWIGPDGVADFDALHSRVNDQSAIACAFDLLMLDGDDLRHKSFVERKAAPRKVLRRAKGGIQYVGHTEGDVVCKLGLEGIISKRLDAPYRSGPSKSWIKTKNPKAAAAMRIIDRNF